MVKHLHLIWQSKPFQWAVLFISMAYLMAAALPNVPFESDGMRIALGVQHNSIYGNLQETGAYRYEAQPGTYNLIGILAPLFGLDHFTVFSYLSIFFCSVFIISSAFFISRAARSSFLVAFFSLLLFQETYVSGYYPNSSIFSAAFFALACLFITYKEKPVLTAISGFCFAMAVWTRTDAVLLGLVFIFFIFLNQRKHFLRTALFFAVPFAAFAGLFFALSNISLINIIEQYGSHVSVTHLKETIIAYSTVFTAVVIFFAAVGLVHSYKQKNWQILFMTLAVPLPLILAYGISVTTPKYLLNIAIFLAIPISYAISSLIQNTIRASKWILIAGVVLFVGQYIFTPAYELILNRSIIVQTDDGPRLRGAIFYTPLFWRNEKVSMVDKDLEFKNKLVTYLETHESDYIISQEWMANQEILYFLQANGYRIADTITYAEVPSNGQRMILKKGADLLYLIRWEPEGDFDVPPFLQEEMTAAGAVLYIGPNYTSIKPAMDCRELAGFRNKKLETWGNYQVVLLH